jgi:hypothetical protein
MIATPYLLYLGHSNDPAGIKTSRGLAVFRPEICIGEFRHDDCGLTLGLPRMDFATAVAGGARTLILGIANANWGRIWWSMLSRRWRPASTSHPACTNV